MSCRDCGHREHAGRMCNKPIGRRGLGWRCRCTAGEAVRQTVGEVQLTPERIAAVEAMLAPLPKKPPRRE